MTSHLSADELRSYRERVLTVNALLRVDDHLAECRHCRERLQANAAVSAAVTELRAQLATEVGARGSQSRYRSPLRRFVWAAAASVVVAVPVWILTVRQPVSVVDRHSTTIRRPSDAPSPGVGARAASAAVGVVDAPGRITLGDDGRLVGIEHLTATAEHLARQALLTGALVVDAETLRLGGADSRWRGGADISFGLYAPVATAVESDRPTFRWQSVPSATTYVVTVEDRASHAVIESPPVKATEWQSERALARGRTYLWQVTARTAAREITAPLPLQAEAAFRVLDAVGAAESAADRSGAAGSHLVLAAIYAARGLLDDAERELKALIELNPGAPLPRRLLEDLYARRQGKHPAPAQEPPAPITTKLAQ